VNEGDHRYLEERVNALRELIDARFDGVDSRLKARDDATILQAREYERRLDDLNNEHDRIAAAVSANVSADTWEAFKRTYDEWRKGVDQTLNEGRGKAQGVSASLGLMLGVAGVVLPFLAAILTYLITHK